MLILVVIRTSNQKFLLIRLLYFLFTIPDKIVFKRFAFFVANLRNNAILVRATSIACTIPYQRLFVPNLIFTDVVLGRSLEENNCSG